MPRKEKHFESVYRVGRIVCGTFASKEVEPLVYIVWMESSVVHLHPAKLNHFFLESIGILRSLMMVIEWLPKHWQIVFEKNG